MDSKIIQNLVDSARQAQQNSHSPYSNFKVGAAVLGANGKIYAGCNVENAAYPLGQCAEATAIGNMITSGTQSIKAVVIASPNDAACYPCGGCRQKIAEFASDDVPVYMSTRSGSLQKVSVGELLPFAFRDSSLAG
ncbi:cytidine deaminase [Salinimonas chungwhensis]|uniref:cytidine deaminase n=1 Tax=Salinimonas chungwhensis TaxID=265425 RepID=UPI000377BF5E|nr:cytidine deaminase [Salinimonas chungwhensis]